MSRWLSWLPILECASMMDFDPTSHPHRRYNPLTGEHVLVSPHRNKRPWQGQTEPPEVSALPVYDPKCYLCPGNTRSNGQRNELYTTTMVFENDFPALLPTPAPAPPPALHPLLQADPVQGACDVIVFHPRHDLTLPRMSKEEIGKIIEEWQQLYLKRGSQAGIKYVQIFENKGTMMGCSNPHPHGQVWSLNEIPTLPATELRYLHEYSQRNSVSKNNLDAPTGPNGRSCLLCDYAHYEATAGEERIVLKRQYWVALVPYWAAWPFEILLLPYTRHVASLLDLNQRETVELASMLKAITTLYDNLFTTSFPYSMGVHQSPTPQQSDIAHLHFHFNPPLLRSATIRKFLVGFEMMGEPQRDLTQEQAAARLRECSDVHYLDTIETELVARR